MSVVSSFLRRSGGFFLRRTFGSDRLYKVVFSLYVQVLLSNGDAPMEFFVEGTRSRTAKSLHPKLGTVTDFSTCSHNPTLQHLLLLLLLSLPPLPPPPGLLSMVVEPYLMGCLPDILLLPVSISYERTVEEQLFARELLGIPKPKESTRVHCLVSFSLFLLSSSISCSHLSLSCCAYYNFRHPSPTSPPPLLFISSHSSPPSHISTTHVITRGCSKLALSSQNAMAPSLSICTLHSPSTWSASPMASAEYLTHSTQSERHFISQSCDHHPITFLQFGHVTLFFQSHVLSSSTLLSPSFSSFFFVLPSSPSLLPSHSRGMSLMLPGERQLILKLGHMILDHTHQGMRIFPSTLIATAVLQNTGGISLGEVEGVSLICEK